jgi:hypothetical protein
VTNEEVGNPRAINALILEYEGWNRVNGLNLGSADEHLFDASLTEAQRNWLHDFVRRWEEAEVFDRDAPKIWIEGPFDHAYFEGEGGLCAAPLFEAGRNGAPFDFSEGVRTFVDDFDVPLSDEQRATVDAALAVAALLPGMRVGAFECTDFDLDPAADGCATWLVMVESPDGTAVYDPYASDCGRFPVAPVEAYGIKAEAAQIMLAHNKVRH